MFVYSNGVVSPVYLAALDGIDYFTINLEMSGIYISALIEFLFHDKNPEVIWGKVIDALHSLNHQQTLSQQAA